MAIMVIKLTLPKARFNKGSACEVAGLATAKLADKAQSSQMNFMAGMRDAL